MWGHFSQRGIADITEERVAVFQEFQALDVSF